VELRIPDERVIGFGVGAEAHARVTMDARAPRCAVQMTTSTRRPPRRWAEGDSRIRVETALREGYSGGAVRRDDVT
jgi:hypothetical protein